QFKNQVMATVNSVVNLYWDLVSFNESLKVKQKTLELNTKLYNDNRRRSELGAIAPIDIIQAEAEVKASQQDVTTAQSQVLQQEMILKSMLTRNGLERLDVITARIVPTDHYTIPAQEDIQPIQDLIAQAMAARPDVAQSRVAMLPQLTAFASMTNNGLAGSVNTLPVPVNLPNGTAASFVRTPADVNGY